MASIDKTLEHLMTWLERAGEGVLAALLAYLPKVLLAGLVLFVGLKAITWLTHWLQLTMEAVNTKTLGRIRSTAMGNSAGYDAVDTENNGEEPHAEPQINPTLSKFVLSVTDKGLKALLLVTVASMVGISATSVVAMITATSFAIGLALQGLLKDLAAGVMLIIFRSYEAGDLVEVADEFGKVHEIGMFETIVHTEDNRTITIPNSLVKTVINYSEQGVIRVDVVVAVGHDASFRQAEEVLLDVLWTSPMVLQAPEAPEVLLKSIDGLGKEFILRAWVRSKDFIPAPFALRRQAILALEDADIALARWPAMGGVPPDAVSEPPPGEGPGPGPAPRLLPTLLGRLQTGRLRRQEELGKKSSGPPPTEDAAGALGMV